MDIIFNFGEHYYETGNSSICMKFFWTFLSAFLGFGSALLIYYIKVKLEKKEEERKRRNESRNRLQYHKLLIENLIKTTKNQINSIAQYKVEQENDLLNAIPVRQVVTNDFKRLININKEIFESFNNLNNNNNNNNNDWIENLKKLHISIDFIEGVFLEIFRITNNHLRESYIKASEIKQNIELIPEKLSLFAFKLSEQLGERKLNNNLYNFVNNSINNYHNLVEAGADFNKINNDFLEPLLNEILINFKKEAFFEEILVLAKKSRVKMDDIKNDVKDMINEMETIKTKLDKTLTKIEESMQKLNV